MTEPGSGSTAVYAGSQDAVVAFLGDPRTHLTDLDLKRRTVHWRAEHDKLGFETVTPLTVAAVKALECYRGEMARHWAAVGLPMPQRDLADALAHVRALVERRSRKRSCRQ